MLKVYIYFSIQISDIFWRNLKVSLNILYLQKNSNDNYVFQDKSVHYWKMEKMFTWCWASFIRLFAVQTIQILPLIKYGLQTVGDFRI